MPRRIEFKRGQTRAMIKGKVRGDEQTEYVLRARAGQELSISLASIPKRSSRMDVEDPDGARLGPQDDTRDHWSATLSKTGDYILVVRRLIKGPGVSKYTMTVRVR